MSAACEQFAALPEQVQEQLVRIGRTAAGMSTLEKQYARLYLGVVIQHSAETVNDEAVPAAQMVAGCGRVVALLDEAAGSAASKLVI